jgi:hypothetical protein
VRGSSAAGAIRYACAELREHHDDPLWWRARLLQRVVAPVHRVHPGHRDGVRVMEEDWDTLVVLDACRADLFEAVDDRSRFDAYRRVQSRGSMTAEWIEENFTGRAFGDTVYVSANPFVTKLAGDAFHHVEPVWRDGFDATHRTVLPGTVADAAREAHARFPDKRLIVHFMQPHYPFVGHEALTYASWDPAEIVGESTGEERPHDPWQALEMGLVDRETVGQAYADNLGPALDAALALAGDVPGRMVLTADHGNLLGERAWPVPVRAYGHPPGLRVPALTTVPRAVLDGERRSIADDGVRPASIEDERRRERRLRALGYR